MTLVDDAFQWAVYEIWVMGNRGLFCHASKISKMSFCNLNRGAERGDLHRLTLTIHRCGKDFTYNKLYILSSLPFLLHLSFLAPFITQSFTCFLPLLFFSHILSIIHLFIYSYICLLKVIWKLSLPFVR